MDNSVLYNKFARLKRSRVCGGNFPIVDSRMDLYFDVGKWDWMCLRRVVGFIPRVDNGSRDFNKSVCLSP